MKTAILIDAIGHIDDDLITGALEYERKPVTARIFGDHTWRGALKKVAMFFLALLIGASVWLAVDEDARAALQRWISYELNGERNYDFVHNGKSPETMPQYQAGWVPEGYYLQEALYDEYGGWIIYWTEVEDAAISIGLTYSLMSSTTVGMYAPEGESQPEELTINGMEAVFYRDSLHEWSTLFWLDEEDGLVFTLSSNLERDDCIRIAESVYADD